MSWVTIVWSMDAAACLTLMSLHLVIGLRRRYWPNFNFALTAAAAAAFTGFAVWMMRAKTPQEFGMALRWAQVPIWALVVSIVLFVRSYLHAGDARLALATIGLRTAALVINFLHSPNLNYDVITGLQTITLWGERISVAQGVRSRWASVGEMSSFLFLLFAILAAREVWRRGELRRAVVVCGSIIIFILFAAIHSSLIHAGVIRAPYLVGIAYLGILAAMSSELTRDVVQGAEFWTRLQQSEEALFESESRTALADEAAGIGHWTFDIAKQELWMDDRARRLYEYPIDEPIDRNRLIEMVDLEDRRRVLESFERSLVEGGAFEREYRIVLSDGSRRWVASRGSIRNGSDGKPARVQGVWIDITRRRDAELEVERQRNELAHLSRAAVLGELSGSIAHELNQPLTAILANAQAAERLLSAKHPDLLEIREALADIVEQGWTAGEVIRRLRLLLTKGEVERQPMDLADVVEDVLALFHSDLVHQGVTVSKDVSADLRPVRADRIQIQQVLLNLITNGCEAMATTQRHRRALVVHAGSASDGHVRISVSDRGSGLSDEQIQRMFEPFFTTKRTGMGLGLAVCRTIVDAHGGRVWAENNAAGGATVSFTLPVAESGSGAPAAAGPAVAKA